MPYICYCLQTGNDLVSREHYNSEEVKERIHTLTLEWEQLTSASSEKGELNNADVGCTMRKIVGTRSFLSNTIKATSTIMRNLLHTIVECH